MNWQTLALSTAGALGASVALVHGAIVQRRIVRPLAALGPDDIPSRVIRRLIPALLHASTFAWFAGGIALLIAAIWFDRIIALAIGALAGTLFLFGAVFNCWATCGRHPGWLLMAIAVALIAFAAIKPGI